MNGVTRTADWMAVEAMTAGSLQRAALGVEPLQTHPAAVARVATLAELTVEGARLRVAAAVVAVAVRHTRHIGVGRAGGGRHQHSQQTETG